MSDHDELRALIARTKANENGCWIWQKGVNRKGYGHLGFGGRTRLAHRISWQLANGRPIPAGLCVMHKCDTPSCINPDHLSLGTIADNTADMVAKDRQARGAHNGRAKLTEAQVREIRATTGMHTAIAARFGVSPTLVRDIRAGKRWGHVPGRDKTAKGRSGPLFGEDHGSAKITAAQASEMIARRKAGAKLAVLVAAYGLSQSQVSRICLGQKWNRPGALRALLTPAPSGCQEDGK